VARAIAVDADVLLMDEPLSNLDALLRLGFRAELKRIVQDLGTTCVYVTHDQVEALSLGDRVAVLREGRIVQIGDPIDVYAAPADRFVGGFLGSPPMNFLDGQLSASGTELRIADQSVAAPAFVREHSGQAIVLGVRAETVTVTDAERPGALAADVVVVEPLGAAVLLTVRLGDQELRVQAPATFRTTPGARVWLTFDPDAMRFYDPESSVALVGVPA